MMLQNLRDAGAWWDGTRAQRRDWYPENLEPSLAHALYDLLARYADELRELDALLRETRERMELRGGVTQFADAEGALLYVTLRETRPTTVFEISPADGWSTNHILAALTQNGSGCVHSFELAAAARDGTPTEVALRRNLHPSLDGDRLEVHVGDARQTVPLVPGTIDALLLDSAHEAWFVEWYVSDVLPRVQGPCMIHDIVGSKGAVKHQRYFDGEAYAVLEWLGSYRVRAVPAAELETGGARARRLDLDSVAILFGVDRPSPPPWAATRPRAAIQQADLALAHGDLLSVHDLIGQALESCDAKTPHLTLQIAERYRRLGLVERARELAHRVAEEQRDEPLWLLQAGRVLVLLGQSRLGWALVLRATRRSDAPRWVRAQSPVDAATRRGVAALSRLAPFSKR